jgi:flagellar FliJ protein
VAVKRFELEQVLKYRVEVERMRTQEFADARRNFEHASDRLSREEAQVESLSMEYCQRHGELNCIEEMRLYADFFARKRCEIKDQQERVNQLGRVMSDQRDILLEAAKDKKVLESLKDRKVREFRQAMDQKEQIFMDEIAVQKRGGSSR